MFVVPIARASALAPRVAFGTALDRLFDESFDRFFGGTRSGAENRTPSMDVSESDTAYSVVLEVPGATREQLKVSIEGRRVTLASAQTSEKTVRPEAEAEVAAGDSKPAERVLYRERSARAYSRTIVLPTEVDQAASQAKFDNGVLTLTLAKKVPAGATQLYIA